MAGIVLQDDFDLVGVADDMVVGHDITGRIDDEARAQRVDLPVRHLEAVPVLLLLFEETAQQLVERGLRVALLAVLRRRLVLVVLIVVTAAAIVVLVVRHHVLAAGVLYDGDVHDSGQHLVDDGRQAGQPFGQRTTADRVGQHRSHRTHRQAGAEHQG